MVTYVVFAAFAVDGTNAPTPVLQSKLQFKVATISGPAAGRRILNTLRKAGLRDELPPGKTEIKVGTGWFILSGPKHKYLVKEQISFDKVHNIIVHKHGRNLTIIAHHGPESDSLFSTVTDRFAHHKFKQTWPSPVGCDSAFRKGTLINSGRILRMARGFADALSIETAIKERYPLILINWVIV